jgi:hypothetical protein
MIVEQIHLTEYRVSGFKVILSPGQQFCFCRRLHCDHMVALLSHLGFDSLQDYSRERLVGQKSPTVVRGFPVD